MAATKMEEESPKQEPVETAAVEKAPSGAQESPCSEPPATAQATPNSEPKAANKKLPVNSTRISLSDPEAELSRSKNGLTELNYKDHRIVDDAYGVITAVEVTYANVGDATQLPSLLEQHSMKMGLPLAGTAVAGDHHYGSAANYIYCIEHGILPHLASADAHLEEKGKLPLSRFVYDPQADRLRCPQGHDLVLHQHRPQEQHKVYLIEDPRHCAECPLREECTQSERGRSLRRHVQAEVVEAGQAEAKSAAGRRSRKRRRHVMEGSYADAANNHGMKRARWRGLWRQRIQSLLIAAVQNWRILFKHAGARPAFEGLTAVALTLDEGGLGLTANFRLAKPLKPLLRRLLLAWVHILNRRDALSIASYCPW
jgi:hypothetical protein